MRNSQCAIIHVYEFSPYCEKEDMKMTDINLYRLSETAAETADSVSNMARLLFGLLGILLLVYLMAELTPKLSEFIDKHFGSEDKEPPKPIDPKDYVVHDPYEGEIKEDNSQNNTNDNNGSDKADTP